MYETLLCTIERLLCTIGFHDPQIVRKVFWGNCWRAELKCACGVRFEALTFRGGRANPLEYVTKAPVPTAFWRAYDAGDLPNTVTGGCVTYYIGPPRSKA
jgi:hypothetical protein